MSTANVTQEITEQQAPECRHHWVIAAPDGAISTGHCKICGESKEFRNSLGDSFWERNSESGTGSTWNRPLRGTVSLPADDGF